LPGSNGLKHLFREEKFFHSQEGLPIIFWHENSKWNLQYKGYKMYLITLSVKKCMNYLDVKKDKNHWTQLCTYGST
jgi:hypothetical protein